MAETDNKQNVPQNTGGGSVSNEENSVSYFSNLPIGDLICTPFIEIARGQAQLCEVYVQTLFKLAYVDSEKAASGEDNTTRSLQFNYTRPVVDETNGTVMPTQFTIDAPLLSLVPIPAFTMDSADVNFNMEVNIANTRQDDTSSSLDTNVSFGFWKVKGSISGKVSGRSSVTSTSSSKATYSISAHAVQQPAAEGMAKLTSLLAETMEPIAMKA